MPFISSLRADVGAPAGNGEDEALGTENLDGAQDGVAANVVFLLELLDRGQWTGTPFTRRDLVAEDGRELPVSRLGQVMIHFHKIKVGQYRPGLISRYNCSALICVSLYLAVPGWLTRVRARSLTGPRVRQGKRSWVCRLIRSPGNSSFIQDHPEWSIHPQDGPRFTAEKDDGTSSHVVARHSLKGLLDRLDEIEAGR